MTSPDELSTEERLLVFDAIHQALEELGPRAIMRMVRSEQGLAWEVAVPAPVVFATGGRVDPFMTHLRARMSTATDIDILAAFVMRSGVSTVMTQLRAALQRGASVRVLTGDYLGRTHAPALRDLLDLAAQGRVEQDEQSAWPGHLEVRVVQLDAFHDDASTFHPKAWILRCGEEGVAFVGSSNLSRAALLDGLEWNLGVGSDLDREGFLHICQAFEKLWGLGRTPTETWLEAYEARQEQERTSFPLPASLLDDDPAPPPPTPRPAQIAALEVLAEARALGKRRALVVLATGLGKTWLAAFDVQRLVRDEPGLRVLVVAHRVELLRQAASTLRRVLPTARQTWCAGQQSDLSGQVVLGSIQKLSRVDLGDPQAFDYVILDEVHHAPAPSYLRLLARLAPAFLLGLTATPARGDGRHAMTLFGGEVAYSAHIHEGIEQKALVPIHYFGLPDPLDYTPIPWRGGRFDPDALARAAQSDERMQRVDEAMRAHDGSRTLVFCCTVAHARFVATWLEAHGWQAASLHSGSGDSERKELATALLEGTLEVLCVVDLFNEGVDLPTVDRVVFLRPTESPVTFVQQLGRGLRTHEDKTHLTVLDLVGNHHTFVARLRTLLEVLSLGASSLRVALERGVETLDLPEGCTLDLQLEAVDILRKLIPTDDDLAIIRAYHDLASRRIERPRALDLWAHGYNPASLRAHGGWFQLVDDEGDLSAAESAVWLRERAWLQALESRQLRSLPHIAVIDAWLDHLATPSTSRRVMLPAGVAASDLLTHLPQLVQATTDGLQWSVHLETLERPEQRAALIDLGRELLAWRVARLTDTAASLPSGAFVVRVMRHGQRAILRLPDRASRPDLPEGDFQARTPGGEVWTFRWTELACQVARRPHTNTNELSDLLTGWFGAEAGGEGTRHHVRFLPAPNGWWVEPVALDDETRDPGPTALAPLHAGEPLESEVYHVLLAQPHLRLTTPETLLSPTHIAPIPGAATGPLPVIADLPDGPRYIGEATPHPEGGWLIPEVEFAVWRALGPPKAPPSRPLPDRWRDEALQLTQRLWVQAANQTLGVGARRFTLQHLSPQGSLQIQPLTARKPRTISLTDLGWVLFARHEASMHDAPHLDEGQVHRFRYLAGTPQGSTRYIDTGWALRLIDAWMALNTPLP